MKSIRYISHRLPVCGSKGIKVLLKRLLIFLALPNIAELCILPPVTFLLPGARRMQGIPFQR